MKEKDQILIEYSFNRLSIEHPDFKAAYKWDSILNLYAIYFYMPMDKRSEKFYRLMDEIENELNQMGIPVDIVPLPELFIPESYDLEKPFLDDVIYIKPLNVQHYVQLNVQYEYQTNGNNNAMPILSISYENIEPIKNTITVKSAA